MPFLEADFKDNNQFLLSYYGNQFALGFKGSKQFIEKSYNLCSNHSISTGRLIYFQSDFSYILTTKKKIINGLKNYFINELKVNKILPLIKDEIVEDEDKDSIDYIIEYNEEAISKIAQEKTENFILKYIKEDNFMVPINKEISNLFYETSLFKKPSGREGLSDLTDVWDDV